MKRLLLLGALALFVFTASAQSDAKTSIEQEKTENVCAKTGEKCSETCSNKKKGTCCEGKQGDDKSSCSKTGDKTSCCSKNNNGDKSSCSKTGGKTNNVKNTTTKAVGMSK